MDEFDPLINVLLNALENSKDFLQRDFFEVSHLQSQNEKLNDFVENANFKAEEKIYNYLIEIKPDFCYELSSQDGVIENKDTSNVFVIQGIDNKTNFSKHFPYFATHIFLKRDKQIYLGVSYMHLTEDVFVYQKNIGVFKNQTRLKPKNTENVKNILVACDIEGNNLLTHNCFARITGNDFLDTLNLVAKQFNACVYKKISKESLELAEIAGYKCQKHQEVTIISNLDTKFLLK